MCEILSSHSDGYGDYPPFFGDSDALYFGRNVR
jgi:hypothetical protein